MIEESGDLSGDLNNLLNQVTRIDLITSDLSITINNLDLDFQNYNDLKDTLEHEGIDNYPYRSSNSLRLSDN